MAFAFNSIHPSILAAAFSSSYSQVDLLILTICICISILYLNEKKKIIVKKRSKFDTFFG